MQRDARRDARSTPRPTSRIEVWSGQSDAAEKAIESLAKEFEKAHPNVTVDLSPGASSTDQLLQKLSAGFAGDQYPDISYAFGSWAGQLEASGRTLDISAEVKKPAVKWDEFTAAARGTAQPSGKKVIGFPAVVDNIGLLYNKTLFDKAGLAYPTADWTWDDFRAAAKKLTDTAEPRLRLRLLGLGQRGDDLAVLAAPLAERRLDPEPYAHQVGVRLDCRHDALTFLRSMAVDDKSVYLDQTDEKFGQLFVSNRIGMITSGPWELSDLKTGGTKYGVVQLPGTNGDHQTVSGPDIWALFDHHDKNRAYWATQFAEWLTSRRSGRALQRGARQPAAALIGGDVGRRAEGGGRSTPATTCSSPTRRTSSRRARRARATRRSPSRSASRSPPCCRGKGEPKSALEQAAKTADAGLNK